MAYPLFLNDIVKLGAHPSDSLHRSKVMLTESSPERLKFLLYFAGRLKLLSPIGKGWRKGENFQSFLKEEPGQLWKQFFDVFMEDNGWDELPMVIKLKTMGDRPCPSEVRKFLLESLKEGETYQEFSLRLKEENHNFYRRGGTWLIRREKRKPDWEELEGRIINLFLRELKWLSILKDGEAVEFTEEGKALLEGKAPSLTREKPLVKPDFEVLLPFNADQEDLFFLETIAEPVSVQGLYIYRITRESILRALERGAKAKEILEYLNAWGPVPENIRENILRWGARFSKIRLRFGIILEVEDSPLLQELMHIKKLKQVMTPINSRYALVNVEDIDEVRKALRSGDYYAEVPPSWEGKKILFLTPEEARALKRVLSQSLEELNYPLNLIIEEVLEKI